MPYINDVLYAFNYKKSHKEDSRVKELAMLVVG
jgi:hypothetical protein